jgi:excinuclease UvrABC nuclease subunit
MSTEHDDSWPLLAAIPPPSQWLPEDELGDWQPGVYLLISSEGEVDYIGQSGNIKERLKQHRREDKKKFERVRWIECLSQSDRLQYEGILILTTRPRYNRGVWVGLRANGTLHDYTKAHFARVKATSQRRKKAK